MNERQDFDRPTRQEDEYFHRRDRELLEQARRAEAVVQERQALSAALGITDEALLQRLQALQVTADNAWLLSWLPAIQIAWLKGLSGGERQWLLDHIREKRGSIDEATASRLDGWLATKPDDGLFAAARAALVTRIGALAPAARAAATADVLDAARGVAGASGGILGVGSVSSDERAALEALARDLGATT